MNLALAEIAAPEFDLGLTLESGQVFHWFRKDCGWLGMIGDQPLYAEQRGDTLLVPAGLETMAARSFALDHPMAEIHATFPHDSTMDAALAACRGLRILRQPLWECLATFITSTQKAGVHIAQMSHALRRRFGRAIEWNGEVFHAYPTPTAMAAMEESDLRACGLGYRAKTLLATARMIASGELDLEAVRALDDEAARTELCRLPGVGVKVANCVLLFAYERVRAFPIDVWIERVLRQSYFARKRKVTAARMADFAATYFGPYGGYAQQYLFHHARTKSRKSS